jgi:hypothetical protein
MKAHFEFPASVTPADIVKYLHDNGIAGTWDCCELNIFRMNGTYTNEKWDLLASMCKSFTINGAEVRGLMIVKRKP